MSDSKKSTRAGFVLTPGMLVWVRVGIGRKMGRLMPYAAQGRRNRTCCVEMYDGKERWVRPDQLEQYFGEPT